MLKPAEDASHGFGERVCLPFLLKTQNEDGGWGYRPGTSSAVEPTAWCLLGLRRINTPDEVIERGHKWLANAQNEDGSWPTRPETHEGNWVTALAGLSMIAVAGAPEAIASAAQWICKSRSGEGKLRWRMVNLLFGKKEVVDQDFALRGWSWTPGTASWVEPTAVALLFLQALPPNLLPPEARERRQMGEAMLRDRMCPSGGWNSGNPKVYGVAGIPQIGPTAWALLALQEQEARDENRRSLDWLESVFDSIDGPSSLALAYLALDAGGRAAPKFEQRLFEHFEAGDFLGSVLAFAQGMFALGQGRDLLRRNIGKE